MGSHPPFRRITDVKALPGGRLLVTFEAGEHRIYSAEWVLREAGPLVLPLRDPNYFGMVRVENDTITWPNGLDLDPAWVYVESEPEEQAAATI